MAMTIIITPLGSKGTSGMKYAVTVTASEEFR